METLEDQIKETMLQITPRQVEPSLTSAKLAEVELTEYEREEALYYARKWKKTRQDREEYAKKIKADQDFPVLNSEQMKDFALEKWSKSGKGVFVTDKSNTEIFNLLCLYFSRDVLFEELFEGGNIDKGIMLCGGVGVGKTTMMQMFFQNCNQSFALVPCRKISDAYQEGGVYGRESFDGIAKYSHPLKSALGSNPFGHRDLGYCFDDLGTETIQAKHYGQDKNVMAETILNRYDNKLPFNMTHLTTNLDAEQIKSSYGLRAFDRMIEMFNVINFPTNAHSRR